MDCKNFKFSDFVSFLNDVQWIDPNTAVVIGSGLYSQVKDSITAETLSDLWVYLGMRLFVNDIVGKYNIMKFGLTAYTDKYGNQGLVEVEDLVVPLKK
jgi:hypothetical protein